MPNYLAETDFVAEAGDILAGRTRKLASEKHLLALQQLIAAIVPLVRLASRNIEYVGDTFDGIEKRVDLEVWLREAAKLER